MLGRTTGSMNRSVLALRRETLTIYSRDGGYNVVRVAIVNEESTLYQHPVE